MKPQNPKEEALLKLKQLLVKARNWHKVQELKNANTQDFEMRYKRLSVLLEKFPYNAN